MRGRKPKPTALKAILGNPGKRALNRREPKPKVSKTVPKPPAYLSAWAKKVWEREAPRAHAIGTLTEADEMAFAALCDAGAIWLEAQGQLAIEAKANGGKLPLVVDGERGHTPTHSLLRIAKEHRQEFFKACGEFGLNPSARSRLECAPEQSEEYSNFYDTFIADAPRVRTGDKEGFKI